MHGTMTARMRLAWLAGAVVMGVAAQWCMVFGPCGAPL